MAQIIGLKEKQLALKDINQKIKSLEPVNEFLKAENPSGVYTISFGTHKSSLLCEDADAIKAFVYAYKKNLVDAIRAKAQEYSIEFDASEEEMLK